MIIFVGIFMDKLYHHVYFVDFFDFFISFISTVIPLIYIDRCFPWYLPIDITMEKFVTKIHYNIPTEKFWICKTRGLDHGLHWILKKVKNFFI